jgi:hypothetical protein
MGSLQGGITLYYELVWIICGGTAMEIMHTLYIQQLHEPPGLP